MFDKLNSFESILGRILGEVMIVSHQIVHSGSQRKENVVKVKRITQL